MSLIFCILLIIGIIYALLKYVYSYWSRHGFKSLKPKIPFGHLEKFIKRERAFGTAVYDLYTATDEPYIGVYFMWQPTLLIRDADIVHRIVTEDFDSFFDRGLLCNQKVEPLSANLFTQRGRVWVDLRRIFTPIFTSGKLKSMFPALLDVGKQLDEYLEPLAERYEVVEMRDTLSNYVLNNIASVFFGMDVNCFKDPNHIFKTLNGEINSKEFIHNLRRASSFLFPKVVEMLNIMTFQQSTKDKIYNLVMDTIEMRQKHGIIRKDFMQQLIELQEISETPEESTNEGKKKLSPWEIVANVFIFYIAGTETSASTASFCLHNLTQNPKIMEKLVKEIDDTLDKHEGKITYECIMEMKYLDMCINETMRKVPGLPILNRECTKDYLIPGSKQVIKKGTSIVISILGMQNDPKYFPEPEKFIPERFREDNKGVMMTEAAYQPFGSGPRKCIAIRMGKMIVKMAVVFLLAKYNFEATDNKPIEFDNYAVALRPRGGINLKVTPRKVTHVR